MGRQYIHNLIFEPDKMYMDCFNLSYWVVCCIFLRYMQRCLCNSSVGVPKNVQTHTIHCSWLAADRTPPAFVRFSVSPLLILTRFCSVDGVGWRGWGYKRHVEGAWNTLLPSLPSWLAADRTPSAFVRCSVSPLLFLTRFCSVDGVGWRGWGY